MEANTTTHYKTLVAELEKIEASVVNTPNIPAKEIIAQQKRFMEIKDALTFITFLHNKNNIPKEESKLVSI